jgi:hypothetical protein
MYGKRRRISQPAQGAAHRRRENENSSGGEWFPKNEDAMRAFDRAG